VELRLGKKEGRKEGKEGRIKEVDEWKKSSS
jgi:hypothetical protein